MKRFTLLLIVLLYGNLLCQEQDVISLIDEKIEFLKQQNGAGVIFKMFKMFNDEQVKNVVDKNNETIKELTELRMKVLEL